MFQNEADKCSLLVEKLAGVVCNELYIGNFFSHA